jgi:hypothetical protein
MDMCSRELLEHSTKPFRDAPMEEGPGVQQIFETGQWKTTEGKVAKSQRVKEITSKRRTEDGEEFALVYLGVCWYLEHASCET